MGDFWEGLKKQGFIRDQDLSGNRGNSMINHNKSCLKEGRKEGFKAVFGEGAAAPHISWRGGCLVFLSFAP